MRLAIFGQPIKHSLSPRIHSAFAGQFDWPVDYRAIEATAESLTRQVRQLLREGGRGCNVTVPFKQMAWHLADRRSREAERAGAANTLVFERDAIHATNTDGGGLVEDIETVLDFPIHGRRVCLLGAGGAARGVLGALLARKPGCVTVVNRTHERALQLAKSHSDLGDVRTATPESASDEGAFDLVINATSLGHKGEVPLLTESLVGASTLCYDMNYGRAATPLAKACEARGLRYSDGLGMLVAQAALSFEIWTGQRPNTQPVLEALRAAPGE